MIVHDVEQGSADWWRVRLGIPTASGMDRIMSPKALRASSSSEEYRTTLLIEWLRGEPLEVEQNEWMVRGHEIEPQARAWYELERGCDVKRVGFITRDDGLVGCSPDGLCASTGILELKAPSPATMDKLIAGKDPGYIGQCQGLLYVTEREWVDLVCYHPEYTPVVKRIERDEKYQEALVPILEAFVMQLEIEKSRLARARRMP